LLPKNLLNMIWAKMTDFYADKWTAKYGVDPASGAGETWAEELYGKNYKQIRAAISACLTRKDTGWPPTLPEFIVLCGRDDKPVGPHSTDRCDACGWDFNEKHFSPSAKNPGQQRLDTRTQVNIKVMRNGELFAVVTRCDVCYLRELDAQGLSQMAMTQVDPISSATARRIDDEFVESMRRAGVPTAHDREEISKALVEDAKRLGFFDPPPAEEAPPCSD
jgi:hypothetical protein